MANLTTAAAAIREVYDPGVVLLTWLNEEFLAAHPKEQSMGDDTYRWTALRTTNASGGTFSDGDPFPAVGDLAFSQPSLPFNGNGWADGFSITDNLRAALNKPGAQVFPVIQVQAEQCLARLRDLITATMLGATGIGIQLGVDSTGTYATIDRAVVTNWAARETAVGGAQTIAVFQNDREAMTLPDRGVDVTSAGYRWYFPPEQITNHMNLIGTGAGTSLVRVLGSAGQLQTNIMDAYRGLVLGAAEIFECRDLTNTVIMAAPKTGPEAIKIVYQDEPDGRTSSGLKVEDVARAGFEDEVIMSWKGILVVPNPFHCLKDTGVTA